MRVLVTGATGFIGRHLVRALMERGDAVTVFVRESKNIPAGVTVIQGDIGDGKSLEQAAEGCEVIFHLAVVLRPDSSADAAEAKLDAEGMKNICDAAVARGIKKIIFASTSAVYGDAHQDEDVTEDLPASPVTIYAQSKREAEVKLAALWKEHGIGSVSMRLFNIYGPGQDARMVIPRFVQNAKKGEPLVINGDGTQIRDFVFVRDAVQAMILLAEKSAGAEIVNIASGRGTSINDLAKTIKTITQSSSEIVHRALPAERKGIDVARRVGSTTKLQKISGYCPEMTVEEGLRVCAIVPAT